MIVRLGTVEMEQKEHLGKAFCQKSWELCDRLWKTAQEGLEWLPAGDVGDDTCTGMYLAHFISSRFIDFTESGLVQRHRDCG